MTSAVRNWWWRRRAAAILMRDCNWFAEEARAYAHKLIATYPPDDGWGPEEAVSVDREYWS